MPGQLRILDGTCSEHCGFNGLVFCVELSNAEKARTVGDFRVWRRWVFSETRSHIGLELMTMNKDSYFIEMCNGRVTLSRPRRVDSSGEWVAAKVRRTLDELEMLPAKKLNFLSCRTCADVVDLLWDALMNQQ